MCLTPRNDSVFNGTFVQVIENLIAGELTFSGKVPDLFQVWNVEVAHAPGKNLPVLPQLFEGRYGFLKRISAAPVQEVTIQAIRLEPTQRSFASRNRCTPGGILRKNLRHQEHFVAPPGNRLTNQPLDAARAVHLRGIDVLHADIEAQAQSGDNRSRIFVVVVPGSLAD